VVAEAPGPGGGYLQVATATGTKEEADRIAARLVERRLAACVQVVGPISSTYRWRGGVESAQEWLCLIKTTAVRYEECSATIVDLHSYDLPEITATPLVAGSPDYLAWMGAETATPD
jgi:periplasmic divalent cation tolerance protein